MKLLETKYMLLKNYLIMHNVFILLVSCTLMMAHTPCLSDVQKISTSRTCLSDLEQFSSSPLYKVSIKTRSQAHAGKILERTELGSHFPMPSTTTSRSLFPSIIKISVGKWKHNLELKAQSEFVD